MLFADALNAPRPWRPLLEGELGARALAEAARIADTLAGAPPGPDGSLAGGAAGDALMFAYLAQVLPDRGYLELASDRLDRAMALVEQTPLPPALFGGFCGVAFALQQLRPALPVDEEDLVAVDQALLDVIDRGRADLPCDLVSGLAGLGGYFLDRLPAPSAREGLCLTVQRLVELAQGDPPSHWITRPGPLAPARFARHFPAGWCDLGLAHGMAGIICFLARASRAEPSRQLGVVVEAATTWLLAQRLAAPATSAFPAIVPQGGAAPRPARTAWCYGDPGIAVALWNAGECCGRADWRQQALALIREAAARPAERTGVVDAGLCHGTGGLMHILNRLHQASADPALVEAGRRWAVATLELRSDDRDPARMAGYRFWDAGDPAGWRPHAGLLEGACGVALALAAAAGRVAPTWDRALGLSVPLAGEVA